MNSNYPPLDRIDPRPENDSHCNCKKMSPILQVVLAFDVMAIVLHQCPTLFLTHMEDSRNFRGSPVFLLGLDFLRRIANLRDLRRRSRNSPMGQPIPASWSTPGVHYMGDCSKIGRKQRRDRYRNHWRRSR